MNYAIRFFSIQAACILAVFASVYGQTPTVRFESSQISVSQRAGAIEIPVVIENSGSVGNYLSILWTTNGGTAVDHRDFGKVSPYTYYKTDGNIRSYPNQSRSSISIPIHYTCSTVNKTFAVTLTSAVDVYTQGAAIGTPATITVTIRDAAGFVLAQKSKLAKIQRQMRRARRIGNSQKRKRAVNRLKLQKRQVERLLCR